jgi:hypothetical protein
VSTALVVFDSPYAKTQETWDVLVSNNKMSQILKQMQASQNATEYVVLIWHDATQCMNIHEVLYAHAFKELSNFYWVKENHHTPTPLSYTNVVEQATLGYYPHRAKCGNNMDMNPRLRGNVADMPAVTRYHKDSTGVTINPCQKPPALFQEFCHRHCPPGSTVLVIGAGAGGEVIGGILAGCNVVAVELDKRQYDGLQKILLDYNEWWTTEQNKEEVEKDVGTDTKEEGSVADTASQAGSVAQPEEASFTPVKCASCGVEMVSTEPQFQCTHESCEPHNVFHAKCVQLDEQQQWVCNDHVNEPDFTKAGGEDTQLEE